MRLVCLLLSSLILAAQEGAIQPRKTLKIFNGKNLDGWYTWLRDHQYQDPNKVFTVVDGMVRVSGQDWGGFATKQSYRDYHLIVEWKWGGKTWAPRLDRARDSGILVHGVGEDGAYGKTWLESVESQIIEGGTGDFILVGGKNKPKMTARVRVNGRESYWTRDGSGTPATKESGRFNWWGRDPQWKDAIGFRGKQDVEKPVGEWNRQEVICDGDKVTNIVNGVVVNHGYGSDHTAGKIQIQSEGAEIYFRRIELRPIKRRPNVQ
jgi:hypothetical protein